MIATKLRSVPERCVGNCLRILRCRLASRRQCGWDGDVISTVVEDVEQRDIAHNARLGAGGVCRISTCNQRLCGRRASESRAVELRREELLEKRDARLVDRLTLCAISLLRYRCVESAEELTCKWRRSSRNYSFVGTCGRPTRYTDEEGAGTRARQETVIHMICEASVCLPEAEGTSRAEYFYRQ